MPRVPPPPFSASVPTNRGPGAVDRQKAATAAPTLTHRQISLFSAIMRNGNLGLAAEATGSSQPTLSRELARLEQVLGFSLFDRVRGRLRPTVRGMALFYEIERSFVGLENIAARALELRLQAGGTLHLACLPALAQALVPRALVHLQKQVPGLGVSVHPMESPWLEQALGEQRYELGLSETAQAPSGVELRPLLELNEVAVLPHGHALARKSILEAADFEGQPFISLAPSDPYRQAIDQQFARSSVQRQMSVETASAVAVCACVRHGLGVAIVNPLTALELEGPGLVFRPVRLNLPFRVNLLLPQVSAPHPQRKELLDALAAAALELSRLASA